LDPAVQTFNITNRFGELTAVNRINLASDSEEIFGYLGPNSSGKTTLIRRLTTVLPPKEGNANVADLDIRRTPNGVREKIGDFAFLAVFTGIMVLIATAAFERVL
jgi:ABC-2 type transport system ATP-binding protein